MSYGRAGLGQASPRNGHCPIGVGRCVAPGTKLTGGVSLGSLGVDALSPQYLREFDATSAALTASGRPRIAARVRSANLGFDADGSGQGLGSYPRRVGGLGFDADGSGTGVGSYPGDDGDGLGLAPAVALLAGKVLGGLFSGPKGPTIQALLTQALGGAATVGGGAVGAARELAEFASNASLPDAAQFAQAWGIVVAQAPATAVQAYQAARTKPALAPGGVTPTELPPFSVASAPVAAGSGGAASLLSTVAQGFFETPAGGQVLSTVTQGAVQAKVGQAKAALASVSPMLLLTSAAALMFVAGQQRGRRGRR